MKRYYIEAYRSLSLCRAYSVMEHRKTPMLWGPYKRLKFARRKATELRKDRCVCTDIMAGETEPRDRGPSFVRVRIIENEL